MNGYRYFRIFLPLLCACLCSLSAMAERGHISLKRAILAKTITVSATSLGGYLGTKNIKLGLTNNTDKEVTVDIEPALIFKPEDTIYQDLVLLGNECIVLGPCESRDLSLRSFCGKSYGRSPLPSLKYNFKKQGDSNMAKTLTYAKANNIDVRLVQNAVWTFTNGHCLNTVYDHANTRVAEDFVKYIATIRKLRIPEFYMEYQLENAIGRPVIATGHEKVFVTMHWGNEGYKHMYLTIYNENGTVYKKIEADQVIDKYGYKVVVEFDPRVDPKGNYIVRLHDENNKTWGQKTVMIGVRACDVL